MLITIGQYINPIEAHIVKGRLEAEGVAAYIQHENHVWANWTLSQALGYVKVQVSPEDVEAASAIIEKYMAGEYTLTEDEDNKNIGQCPQCGSIRTEQVDWSWKLALWIMILFPLAIPYTIYRVECTECHHIWTQKELRAHPLWISAFAIFLIAMGFVIFERMFYYLCKINYLSERCM